MKNRISLDEVLWPVQSYFNWLKPEEMMNALKKFSVGEGYFSEDHTCHFPVDQVDEEGGEITDYRFIEFWTYAGNKDVRISFDQFLEILRQVASEEAQSQPENADEINDLVAKTEAYLKSI